MLRVKFYKARALVFILIAKFLSKIFMVELPPIVSVCAFIEKDGKMLFLDMSYLKGFGIPGGIVQDNEDAEAALLREVIEETGLRVISKKYLWSVALNKGGLSTLLLVYTAEVAGEERGSVEGKLVWMKPEDAVGKMGYKNSDIALRKYISERK